MSSYAEVTHVESETEEYGLRVEVTIRRMPTTAYASEWPNAADLPEDIRDALAAWLEEGA